MAPQWMAPLAEDDILPGGVPVSEFAATVSGWQPLLVVNSVLRARQTWQVHEEDTPRLRLAMQLVMAARQTALFDMLDTVCVTWWRSVGLQCFPPAGGFLK